MERESLGAPDLDELLRGTITPLLRQHGFRGGPRSYWRMTHQIYCTIQIQASVSNRYDLVRFAVNYGLRHDSVARVLGVEGPSARSFAGAQLGRRVARDTTSSWWEYRDLAAAVAAADEVGVALDSEVLPFFAEYGTPTGYRRYWMEEPGPYATMFIDALDKLAAG